MFRTDELCSNTNTHENAHLLYEIVPVTEARRTAFYNLIQEQALQHDALDKSDAETHSRELLNAVAHTGELQAFLVVERASLTPLSAVTYYDCFNHGGHGQYLEDIITTQAARRRGVGSFAFAALAQITLELGGHALSWECARHNHAGQAFYDRHGSQRFDDLETFRAGARFMNAAHTPLSPVQGLRVHRPHPHLLSLSLSSGAMADAYRSYSTFRRVSGLHVNRLGIVGDNPHQVGEILHEAAHLQAAHGWTGHLDVTLTGHQQQAFGHEIARLGFAPLAYGEDRMVPRSLAGPALEAVAHRYGGDLIGPLRGALTRRRQALTVPQSAPYGAPRFA